MYSTGAYDRNSKFALRKSTSIFSITHVTDNNALHRMVLAIVVDELHTVEERSTPELSMLGVAALSLSYNSNLKIALSIKIQHPANNI